MDGVVLGLEEEGWRSVCRGVDAAGELGKRWRLGEVTRVNGDYKIRASADSRFSSWFAGAFEVRVIAENNDKMTSCRKAEDSYALRIEVPLGGMGAGDAHGLLRVFKVGGGVGIALFHRNAVFNQGAVHMNRVEPGADLRAFEIVGEDAIASAGEDHNSGSVTLGSRIESKGWLADVGQVLERLTFDEAVGGFGDVRFGITAVGFGIAIGP